MRWTPIKKLVSFFVHETWTLQKLESILITRAENTFLRHCFILLGEYTKKDPYFILHSYQTLGFYQNKQGSVRDVIFKNEDLNGKVISCMNVKTLINEDQDALWASITGHFRKHVKQGYSFLDHNCCSVAYAAIAVVGGDASLIEADNFNCGVGILKGYPLISEVSKLLLDSSASFGGLVFSKGDKDLEKEPSPDL